MKIVKWGQGQSWPECNVLCCFPVRVSWNRDRKRAWLRLALPRGRDIRQNPVPLHGEGYDSMLKTSSDPEKLLHVHTKAYRFV